MWGSPARKLLCGTDRGEGNATDQELNGPAAASGSGLRPGFGLAIRKPRHRGSTVDKSHQAVADPEERNGGWQTVDVRDRGVVAKPGSFRTRLPAQGFVEFTRSRGGAHLTPTAPPGV